MTGPVQRKRTFDEASVTCPSSPATIYTLLASGKDIIPLVLRHLPTVQDVGSLRLCSRQFRQIVSALPAEFFRHYIENYKQTPKRLIFVDEFTQRYEIGNRQGIRIFRKYAPQLNNLRIHVQPSTGEGLYQTLEDFQILASQGAKITELDWEFLPRMTTIEIDQQIALLYYFTNLAHVRLCFSGIQNIVERCNTSLFLMLAGLKTLHTLTISYSGLFNPEFYRFQDVAWPHLRHLKIYVGKKNSGGNFLYFGPQQNSFGDHTLLNNICNRLQRFQHLDSLSLLACPFNLQEGDVEQGELLKKLIDRIPTKSCELCFDFRVMDWGERVKYPFKLQVTKDPVLSVACWINNASYQGPFKDYLPHGKGKLVAKSGEILFEGEFIEGVPHSDYLEKIIDRA